MSWMLTKQQSHPRQAERRCILGRTAAATWLLVIGFTGEAQAEDARPRATMAAERALTPAGDGSRTGSLEDRAVCGFWTERLLAALYHFVAGRPDPARVRGIPGLERVTFSTTDGRRLGGDKLRAYADERRRPRGDVLIALGNAMLADQVVGAFRFLQADGFDVHVHDYRGYGLSEGRSRLLAIRADHIALIEHLNGAGYRHRFLYGLSLGGVFLLHAVAAGVGYDAALIDAAPSRISDYGCPPWFDPVETLPRDGARLGFLFGQRDTVVPPGAWRELSETARARGAVVLERAELAHPLMNVDPWARQARFGLVRAFFAGRAR
jgi:hypothetical protein